MDLFYSIVQKDEDMFIFNDQINIYSGNTSQHITLVNAA